MMQSLDRAKIEKMDPYCPDFVGPIKMKDAEESF